MDERGIRSDATEWWNGHVMTVLVAGVGTQNTCLIGGGSVCDIFTTFTFSDSETGTTYTRSDGRWSGGNTGYSRGDYR